MPARKDTAGQGIAWMEVSVLDRSTRCGLMMALLTATTFAQPVDERPAKDGDWGFRPAHQSAVHRTPPAFSWRPQKDASSYELQIARDEGFEDLAYQSKDIAFNVHCPNEALAPGSWHWRFRVRHGDDISEWSRARSFVVPEDAVSFPLPARESLLARVPGSHPRLFVRPEQQELLRSVKDDSTDYRALIEHCEKLLSDPPDSEEPPKYPEGTVYKSEEWRAIWWGNRRYTIEVLENASKLAFAYWLEGDERFGRAAKDLLMAAAAWDPKGATGYRYNDEAGMPYAYHFSRTYTFLHDFLSEEERTACQKVMRIRGREMYAHLHPRHLWQPYSSHSNRAWHFLGEVGIAFHGEIPEAEDWVWFALNVFANVYPVWSDADGGWHEGMAYWQSYLSRFTWWADVMKAAVGLDAYRLPFFANCGDFALYLVPPGSTGGGFGDLAQRTDAERLRPFMTTLAQQAGNAYWRWYVEQAGGPKSVGGFIGFLRSASADVAPKAPADLPTSKLFEGTGVAVLNSTILDGRDNIGIRFKSSPFGTQSHGYDSNNSFLVTAFGKRLLIRSGQRDVYGSDHHTKWMWQTKSTNSIAIGGHGQRAHSAAAVGRIGDFVTTETIDYVRGEAAASYAKDVERFDRGILFVKPDLIVVHDRIHSKAPQKMQWFLHALAPFEIDGQTTLLRLDDVACRIEHLAPKVGLSQVDRCDPPPRERVTLTQFHLTAETEEKASSQTFVTVIRVWRRNGAEDPEAVAGTPPASMLEEVDGGYVLRATSGERRVTVLLRRDGEALITGAGLETHGEIAVRVSGGGEAEATLVR
ncbi:MAG: DUF4962 domain-containing protein [Planctomycetota bacterium]